MFKEILLKELIKKGYSREEGVNVWDISDRSLRYINKEMAESYLKLNEHPRYKATIIETEKKLLKDHITEFLKGIQDSSFNLIDMACTDGEKAKVIITHLQKEAKFRYCPVNINEHLVKLSLENIKKENFKNVEEYAPRISQNFESLGQIGAALRNNKYQKNVLLLLNSLLASFDINDYLFNLSQSMLPGDVLIIGNGIRKGERFANLDTYKHPAFNTWLIHLMKALGFKDNEVEYKARFAHNRLEVYYKIKVGKTLEYENRKIELKENDEIIVAFQYKLYPNELRDFCDMYFDNVKIVVDKEDEYALVFCKK